MTQAILAPRAKFNPYQRLLAEKLAALGAGVQLAPNLDSIRLRAPDVVHLHWLHPLYSGDDRRATDARSRELVRTLEDLKRQGVGIAWTAHNLHDHEDRFPEADRWCTGMTIELADVVFCHSEAAREALLARFEVADAGKMLVLPHGHYLDAYPNDIDAVQARDGLEIDREPFVFLFFGALRRYKGVLELIAAHRAMASQNNSVLVIAGRGADADLERAIEIAIAGEPSVRFLSGWVPEDRVQFLLNAADVVVFPYRDVLTSGGIVLAMSFAKPVIAPAIGGIVETVDGGAFLYSTESDGSLLDAMRRAVEHRRELPGMGRQNLERVREWSWDRVAADTLAAYEQCRRG